MSVDDFRPSLRPAWVAACVLLGMVASVSAQTEQPPASESAPAPGQGSADALFKSGAAALAAKNFTAAEEAFRQVRELEPKNHRGLLALVDTYLAQNKTDQALYFLETSSTLEPASLDLTMALANVYSRMGKWDQAIPQFQKLIGSTDKQSKAAGELYLAMGEAFRRKGDTPSAIAAFRNARSTLPNDARVLAALAMALDATSSWEAQQAYEDAVRVAPNNALLLNNLAFKLAESGADLDRALSLARRAQQSLPAMAEIADTLGWIYLKKDMVFEARAILAPLVQKQPGNAGIRAHLAAALEWHNEPSPALQTLAKALREQPTEANQRLVLELLNRSGLPTGAAPGK
jgi:tetratricopeptide (TPR) repeat protein